MDERQIIREGLQSLLGGPAADLSGRAKTVLSADVDWQVSAPVGAATGPDAVREMFLEPLRHAFTGLHRRDEIFIGGPNRRETGGDWMSSVTHYVGNFTSDLWGVRASDRLAFLRAGEFYRIENGQITTARIIVDLPDLMHQAGRSPWPGLSGTEILFPGPATHDGVCPTPRSKGSASLDVVEGMLGDLHVFDPDTFESKDQTGEGGYWAPDMMWYGPCGIGSNYRWDGFVKDHREPFLTAFPDRKGGNHYCRIGDGDYASVSGWPSMTMTHQGDYLGVKATGKAMTLKVMDFYRCAGGRIAENWVMLDYVELFEQMGVDLIARGQ